MSKEFKCPYCGSTTILELGDIEIGYEVLGFDEDGNLEYGDNEIFYDSYWPHDYSYYCRECNKSFDYDFDKNEYIKMPE
jgi:hypothetical protein